MRKVLSIFIAGVLATFSLCGQSRAELEELRKKNLQDIEYVDRMLKNTATQKSENLNELQRKNGKKFSIS